MVYNASNNELVRTKTLVKSAIVQIDPAPFRQWYEQHYGVAIGKKTKKVRDGGSDDGDGDVEGVHVHWAHSSWSVGALGPVWKRSG